MKIVFLLAIIFQSVLCFSQNNNEIKFIYTSPKPNSKLHHVSTNIILRSDKKLREYTLNKSLLFSVEGQQSGIHQINLILAKDRKTINLDPVDDFAHNEIVRVTARNRNGEILLQFDFTASGKYHKAKQGVSDDLTINEYAKTQAQLDYTITNNSGPALGNLFFSTFGQPEKPVNIVDTAGVILFSEDLENEGWEWKVNLNDHLTFFDRTTSGWIVMNSFYSRVDTVFCANGYTADYHEILALPNGNYLIMAYDLQQYGMDTVVPGGDPNAIVEGLIIQELDSDHNLLLQWRSWDHYAVTDNIYLNLTESNLNFIHGNSIDVDFDGNLIISARDLDEVTKIHRQTGDIIWRWGGSQTDFTFSGSYPFTRQHCARSIGGNRYLLFDNGSYSAQYNGGENISRAVEFELDTISMAAVMIWDYKHQDQLYAPNLGSVQRLPNGGTLMAFGNLGGEGRGAIILEVDTNDLVTFELECAFGQSIYRAHKHDWFFNDEIVGCSDSTSCNYDPLVVIPDNSCTNQIQPPIIYQEGETLTAFSEVSSSLFQYVWNNGETGQIIEVSEAGEYWVTILGPNECESDTTFFNVETLAIQQSDSFRPQKVIRIFDVMGRSTTFEPGELLFYQMDDGTITKKISIHN
jgi:hypothetical protein